MQREEADSYRAHLRWDVHGRSAADQAPPRPLSGPLNLNPCGSLDRRLCALAFPDAFPYMYSLSVCSRVVGRGSATWRDVTLKRCSSTNSSWERPAEHAHGPVRRARGRVYRCRHVQDGGKKPCSN